LSIFGSIAEAYCISRAFPNLVADVIFTGEGILPLLSVGRRSIPSAKGPLSAVEIFFACFFAVVGCGGGDCRGVVSLEDIAEREFRIFLFRQVIFRLVVQRIAFVYFIRILLLLVNGDGEFWLHGLCFK
jgi:hypothetical protein